MPLYIGNTNQFLVRGFRDPLVTPKSSSYLNAASTATWDLRTAANGGGTSVASGSLTYLTDSQGTYYFRIPAGTALTLNTLYYVSVILAQTSLGDTVQFSAEQELTALLRRGHTPNN